MRPRQPAPPLLNRLRGDIRQKSNELIERSQTLRYKSEELLSRDWVFESRLRSRQKDETQQPDPQGSNS